MEDKSFTRIMSNMSILAKRCCQVNNSYNQHRITTTTQAKARNIQSYMDKIFMNEVYHIIAMGDLTSAQLEQFNVAIKTLGKYRPVVKLIASMQTVEKYPVVIKKSKYKSLLTGTILEGGQ